MATAGRGSNRQVAGPQFFHVRQFVQIAQTEMIEKKLRGLVEKGRPEFRPDRKF